MPDRVARRSARLDGLGTTVFAEMTALAQSTGAINLGQGFPDIDGPREAIEAAVSALRGGENQYAPLPGVPDLRDAVLAHQRDHYGLEPEDVLITFGATEAIAAAILALCDPGDEVVVLEPLYDSYGATITFAGATRRLWKPRSPVGPDARGCCCSTLPTTRPGGCSMRRSSRSSRARA
jgi:N-succinyldiaminopimelate aminotransferase